MASCSEEKICRIVVEYLISEFEGTNFVITDKPDCNNRTSKDVDYVGKSSDGKKIAIEHTSIDSFSDQRGKSSANASFLEDIRNRVTGALPTNHYFRLILPSNFAKMLHSQRLKRLASIIADCVTANTDILMQDTDIRLHMTATGKMIGLTYGGSHPKLNGKIILVQDIPSDIEKQRTQRIRTALREKLPKLNRYRRHNCITVLALEDSDYALSDKNYVESALRVARWRHIFDLPTYIVYVHTYEGNIQEILVQKNRTQWFSKVKHKGPYYLDSGKLKMIEEKGL
jgi:hypothetical protein